MNQPSDLLAGLDKLERILGDGSTWTKTFRGCIARAAAAADDYYGHETTPVQAALCATLGKPPKYGWLMDWNDRPATTFADVKKLIADTRARLQSATA